MSHATLPALSSLTPLHHAVLGFLSRYGGETRDGYEYHLRRFITWCEQHDLDAMTAQRTHVELYVRYLTEERGLRASSVNTALSPVKGMYRFAMVDGLIDRDPAAYARLPKVHYRRKTALDRHELVRMLMTAKETSPRHWALIELLAVMALRISETLPLTADSFTTVERGHHILRFVGKGSKPAAMPLPPAVLRSLEAAAADNPYGTLVCQLDGSPITRGGATGLVNTVARRAQIGRKVNPHLLRASVITQAFEAGLPTRDVQNLARHEDPRTTSRHYDLGRENHDGHAVHILAARLAA